MENNSEFQIARWEYEGGSIGRQETQPEEHIPAENPPTLDLRTLSTDGRIEAFARTGRGVPIQRPRPRPGIKRSFPFVRT